MSSAVLNVFLPNRNKPAENCNQKATSTKENCDLFCFALRGKVRFDNEKDSGLQKRRCQEAGGIGRCWISQKDF